MTKTQVASICRSVAKDQGKKLTRDQKYMIFNDVCDGLLQQGKITQKQQQSWTHAF
jgi:hypothetical protein